MKDLSTTGGHVGRKKRLALAIGAALLSGAFSVMPTAEAHPILDAAGAGVSVTGTSNMSITSSATNNLIKWVDFSIGSGEKVTFDAKNYLNYVTGHAVSDIQGTLTGGGNIYLVNPNGILIGDGATISVGSLHLSTKELSAANLADYTTATGALSSVSIGTGDVINMGTLNATNISVEGNNITFKNVADVKNATDTTGNTLLGGANVKLTAKSGREIHIGSAGGTASGYTVSGAEEIDYKLISTADELQAINTDDTTRYGNYMLAGNIDMSGVSGFTPIDFHGRFDGLNYQIQNLAIESNYEDVGLFGNNRGVIENVGLVGGSVTGTNYHGVVGGIVGFNASNSTVRNVYNTGSVTGMATMPGFGNTGGIVGNNHGTVERAYNTGAVTGASGSGSVGGIVGHNASNSTVRQVYNAGTVSAPNQNKVGGIAGKANSNSSIRDAYNTGAVSGGSQIGGIAGYQDAAIITNVYNSGTVNGSTVTEICGSSGTYVGGIVGQVSNNTTSPTNAYTSNLKNAETFTGFDFSENGIWRIYEGQTTPLLTTFMTRKDNITNTTTEYNGTGEGKTGDVGGAVYAATTYNAAEAQIGGANYISDVSKVTPKTLTLTGGVNKTYDGNTTATITADHLSGVVEGDTLTVSTTSATYADKNAGTGKTVTYEGLALSGDKAKNYTIVADGTTTGTITAKQIHATFGSSGYVYKTYDGTTSVTVACSSTGIVSGDTVTITGTADFEDRNVGTGKKVNNYTVRLGGEDAANYTVSSATVMGRGTISAKQLTATFADTSKTYDGGLNVTAGAGSLDGVIDGDTVSVTGTAKFTDKNVGTNKTVNYTGVALSGTDAGNYTVAATAEGKGGITAKEITATFADTSKTYDGTTDATPGVATLTGVIDGDTVTVSGTAAFTDKNVGTNKTVNYTSVALGGADKGNYSLASDTAEGKGTISKANVTFSVTDGYSRVYNGGTDADGATAKVASGEIFTGDSFSGGTFSFADKNAGTGKTLSVEDVTINDGNGGNNYDVSYTAGKGTITKKNLTATFADISKTYDGTTIATAGVGSLAGVLDGDAGKVSVASATATYADKNAGENKNVNYTGVTLTGDEAKNYAVSSATGKGRIEKADVTISAADYSRPYDGTTDASGATLAVTSGRIFDGDAISGGTRTFDGKDAGAHTISVSSVTVSDGNGGNNYNVTYQENTSSAITRRALSLVAAPVTITEGEATPTTWSGSVTGFVAGEGLDANDTLSFALDNPAAAAVGSYKVTGTLSIGGAAPLASGNYGANYTFANAAANDAAFTIAAKSMTPQEIVSDHIAVSGAAQEYTGTITTLESTARDENQAAPPQEKLAAGTTASHTSHLTIENGGVNTPPNMDVAAALAAGAAAERSAEEDEEEEA